MAKFHVHLEVSIEEDDAHLMSFFPATLKSKMAGTKVNIDSVSVTEIPEANE